MHKTPLEDFSGVCFYGVSEIGIAVAIMGREEIVGVGVRETAFHLAETPNS